MKKLTLFLKINSSILIILVGSVLLRFYNLFDIPFTHDEFSTLFRTNFSSFNELIEKGVKIDGHPAGLQVFVYYFKILFGSEEWVIKIPFLLFGLGSIWLVYVIYSKWYNKTFGLISAAFLATLQYTVMYSQIARPYISGMFFVLALVYFWNALFIDNKHRWIQYVGYVLVADLCLYNHHFSALMAVIISLTGLFFVDRKTCWKYLLAGVGITLFYLPHISILQAQLALKGLAWLNKPTLNFVRDYFCYLGQFSWFILLLCIGLFSLCFVRFQKRAYFSTKTLVSLLWFVLPFTIGFLYSVYRAPLLQYSVLIFSFPFLFPVLFGGLNSFSNKINFVLVILILVVNSWVLIFQRQHYTLFYESIYKEIVSQAKKQNFTKTVILLDAVGTNKDIIEHYRSTMKLTYPIRWLDSFKNLGEFRSFIKEMSRHHAEVYFGAMYDSRPTFISIIQEFYPTLEKRNNYISGSTFVFSKKRKNIKRISLMNFTHDVIHWNPLKNYSNYLLGTSLQMDSTIEYSIGYTDLVSNTLPEPYEVLDVSLRIQIPTNRCNACIVSSIDLPTTNLHWSSTNFSEYLDTMQTNLGWITIKHSICVDQNVIAEKEAKISIYVWNMKKEFFRIRDFQLSIRKDNPIKYGLYFPLK